MRQYKIGVLFLFSIIVCKALFAQTNSKSPYSIYGIGDEESEGLTNQFSMGDTKYGIASPYLINAANAATFGIINQTTFDVGLKVNFLTLTNDVQSQKTYNSYLKNINFVFPVSKYWGLGFGLQPYTNMGYNIEDTETIVGVGDVTYTYEGSGGLNKGYIGNAVNIFKDTIHHLGIGFKASYLFGNLYKERNVIIDDFDSYKTKYQNETLLYGYNFDASIFYKRKFGDNIVSAGVVYGFGSDLKTYTSDIVYTYRGASVTIPVDTIVFASDTGKTTLPTKLGIGASVNFSEKLTVAFDYSSTNWSSFGLLNVPSGLSDRSQYALGLQYIPDYLAVSSIKKIVRYRAGFRYVNSRLMVSNTNLKEFGMTFGVGIPIIKSVSTTMFNVGIEYGQRGTVQNALTKEQFTNIIVGFSLTPHKFDRWFVKRKID